MLRGRIHKHFHQWDQSLTAFVLDGLPAPQLTDVNHRYLRRKSLNVPRGQLGYFIETTTSDDSAANAFVCYTKRNAVIAFGNTAGPGVAIRPTFF